MRWGGVAFPAFAAVFWRVKFAQNPPFYIIYLVNIPVLLGIVQIYIGTIDF